MDVSDRRDPFAGREVGARLPMYALGRRHRALADAGGSATRQQANTAAHLLDMA